MFLSPAAYLHDFSEWLYQSKILSLKLVAPEQVQGFTVFPYLVPNSLVLYIMAVLHLIFPPLVVGKLFISLYVVAWGLVTRIFVWRYYDKHMPRTTAWAFLVCLGCFSSFFWYGYIAYQTGLLLLIWFLGIYRAGTSSYLIIIFSLLIFLAHAGILIQFGLLIFLGVLLNGYSFRQLLALLPSGLLSLAYIAGRFSAGSTPLLSQSQWSGWLETAIHKTGTITMHGPFKNFVLPDGTTVLDAWSWVYWLGVVSNVAVIAVTGLLASLALIKLLHSGIRRIGTQDSTRLLFYFALCLILIYLLAPLNFFGLIHPGSRVVLPAFFVLMVLVSRSGLRLPIGLVLVSVLVTLFTVTSYLAIVSPIKNVSSVVQRQPEPPPESAGKSVLAFNSWLYKNTRYKYYNYRIFVFNRRNVQLQIGEYAGFSFKTGPISGFQKQQDQATKR